MEFIANKARRRRSKNRFWGVKITDYNPPCFSPLANKGGVKLENPAEGRIFFGFELENNAEIVFLARKIDVLM